MINFVWDSKFKRDYKKLIKQNPYLKELIFEKFEMFSVDPFSSELKTHKLKGKLKEYWAFFVEYALRVIFRFINDKNVLLIDIGNHKKVY